MAADVAIMLNIVASSAVAGAVPMDVAVAFDAAVARQTGPDSRIASKGAVAAKCCQGVIQPLSAPKHLQTRNQWPSRGSTPLVGGGRNGPSSFTYLRGWPASPLSNYPTGGPDAPGSRPW